MDNYNQLNPSRWVQIIAITLLVVGIFFRFVNIDKKLYWEDETYTSSWVAGYSDEEITAQLYNGKEISTEDLQKYQRISPDKSVLDTVKVLSRRSEHPPLYYTIARFWAQGFGSSVTAMRTLPALISLLVFPAIYWLSLELFESSTVGWVAVALTSVSPLFLRYAQESRQYSLWAVMILVSGIALLRAIRLHTKLSWVTYAVTVVLSLYTHFFSIFVLIGHAIYVAVISRFHLTKTTGAYLLAAGIGFLTFTPWLLFIAIYKPFTIMQWTKTSLPFLAWLMAYINNNSRVLWAWYPSNFWLIGLPIFILSIYSIYFLCRQTRKRVWLFVLSQILATQLVLVLPDLIRGGRRALVDRYAFPYYLCILLAVAYLIATKINWKSTIPQINLWQILAVLIISGEVLSSAVISPAETWWGHGEFTVKASRIINQATSPLVISDIRQGLITALSYQLDPKVRLLLVVDPNITKIPDGYSDVFLFNSSKRLRKKIEEDKQVKNELIYQRREEYLWKIKRL